MTVSPAVLARPALARRSRTLAQFSLARPSLAGKAALKAARKTTTTKGAKSRPNDDDDDDDDELMMGSDDERDQHSPADETTVVAETQFGEPAAAGSKKGSKGTAAPAAAKRRPAAASKKAAATTDEFDVAEQEQTNAKGSSAREKKLEAQLALVRSTLSCDPCLDLAQLTARSPPIHRRKRRWQTTRKSLRS